MAAGQIEDRWLNKRKDPVTGKRERTARWGVGKRYRVKGIPGVRDRSFDTLDAAKRWRSTASTDTERGTFYDPRAGNITLREYVEQTWWPGLRRPPTTKNSMHPRIFTHILPHVGSMRLNEIGPDEIRLWLAAVEQKLDVNTAIVTWRHFSSIMQSAYKSRPPKIPANPFRDEDLRPPAAPPSKAKAWPDGTVNAVREELSARYRILLDLGVGAGLRQGEAFGFSPEDIDGDQIQVTRQIIRVGGKLAFAPPKGNKTRSAPCAPELAVLVKAHAAEFPTVAVTLPWVDPDRPHVPWDERPLRTVRLLTTTPRTTGLSGGAINRATFDDKQWKPALARAGVIPKPATEYVKGKGKKPWARVEWKMPREEGFHVTRHTFASVVLAEGETITQLAAWLGHSDPAFTLRTYVHFMPTSGSRGISALSAMFASRAVGVSTTAQTR
ncbi:tyrosine-type recombinase/integrase [Streptomyces sp. NPDC059783]|uniref:tyrosine-type recombinase/integrase n=1 Tax=Streptomyces sp. NPDC059783 TaxID=3346944 RepID=UPI00366765E6